LLFRWVIIHEKHKSIDSRRAVSKILKVKRDKSKVEKVLSVPKGEESMYRTRRECGLEVVVNTYSK